MQPKPTRQAQINKGSMLIILLAIFTMTMFGFVLPMLFSTKSDLAVIVGVALLIFAIFFFFKVLSQIIKLMLGEEDVNDNDDQFKPTASL